MGRTFRIAERLLALLLALAALPVGAAAAGEGDYPAMSLQARYSNATGDGRISLLLRLNIDTGSGSRGIDAARNVRVTLTGENGLAVSPSSYTYERVPRVMVMEPALRYADPVPGKGIPEENPKLRVLVTSDNCGALEYECEMDVQPVTRALVLYRTDVDWGADIGRSADFVMGSLADGTYYGHAAISVRCENQPLWGRGAPEDGDLSGLSRLTGWETDDNDLTLIYVGTHGEMGPDYRPNGYISWPGMSKNHAPISDILEYAQTVRGRVAVILDCCFSGKIVDLAQTWKLDPERFLVISATTANLSEGETGGMTSFGHILSRILARREGPLFGADARDGTQGLALAGQHSKEFLLSLFSIAVASSNLSVKTMAEKDFNLSFDEIADAWLHDLENRAQDSETTKELKAYGRGLAALFLQPEQFLDEPDTFTLPQFYGRGEIPLFPNGADIDDGFRLLVCRPETETQSFYESAISGRVLDETTGTALAGVTVTCACGTEERSAETGAPLTFARTLTAVTDAKGAFTFERVSAGAYALHFAKDGYSDADCAGTMEPFTRTVLLDPVGMTPVGDGVFFGRYEQDNDLDNGPEPIEWIVLETDEAGHRMLLITRFGIDAREYHEVYAGVTWETCTLRAWLNDEFLNTAFTPEEQAAILLTDVDNSQSQGYGGWNSDGGRDTQDRIFLLSVAEAGRYFGARHFQEDGGDSEAARTAPTPYALARGAFTNDEDGSATSDGRIPGWWYLRSPGYGQRDAAIVAPNGFVSYYCVNEDHYPVHTDEPPSGMVRPALWVDLDAGGFRPE